MPQNVASDQGLHCLPYGTKEYKCPNITYKFMYKLSDMKHSININPILGSPLRTSIAPDKALFFSNKVYDKCPKILNTEVSDKNTYANSADPDQTAPEGAV